MEEQSAQGWLNNILNQASEKASKQIESDTKVAEGEPDGDILRMLSQGDKLLTSNTFKFLINQVIATSRHESERDAGVKHDAAVEKYQNFMFELQGTISTQKQKIAKLEIESVALQTHVTMLKQQLEFSRELSKMSAGSGNAFANLPPKMREGYSVAETVSVFVQELFKAQHEVTDEDIGRWVRQHVPELSG